MLSAADDLTNYYNRLNVIDPSAGANYSGGSSWDPEIPLTPSNSGLAGLGDSMPGAGTVAAVGAVGVFAMLLNVALYGLAGYGAYKFYTRND